MAYFNANQSISSTAVLDMTHSHAGRGTGDDKRLRKRLQNRAHQRARRLRLQEQNEENAKGRRSFKVHRWRIDPGRTETSLQVARHSASNYLLADDYVEVECSFDVCGANMPFVPSKVPPSIDQLLNLIHFNVFRGCYRNKIILGRAAVSMFLDKDPVRFDVSWPAYSRVVPIQPGIPEKLMPNQSQMDIIHTTWINVLPFPKMRENLIRREACFSHKEFIRDMMGTGPDPLLFPQRHYMPSKPNVQTRMVLPEEDDELTTGRTGMILWGEPYIIDSWEVTPGFLRKWAWTMEGCEELISSTNKWRSIRGEEPLSFSVWSEKSVYDSLA